MQRQIINKVASLRKELHNIAERSGEETKTKTHLMDFLHKNTNMRIEDNGKWFCALHEEADAHETIAFRADMDALPFGDGAAHLCGHDGHSAILAGLGLLLENKTLGRNVMLIFQNSEENGNGGKTCCKALKEHNAARVYAFHNVPGWDENIIVIRNGTFACASRGMTLYFAGIPSHAAYPENGRNPGFAAARFISALPEITDRNLYGGLTMATLIGAEIGKKAFGCAAGKAEVWLTLRSWHDDDLNILISNIKKSALNEASKSNIEVSFSYCDIFPATVNNSDALNRVKNVCLKSGLSFTEAAEPFRWSEDFGYYGSYSKAAMVGIGSGLRWPQLHTASYIFNDNIIPTALTLFSNLAISG